MGANTGLVMFLWIVGAPAIGFALLSLWAPRKTPWEVRYGPAPARRETRTRHSSDESNLPF